MDILTQVAIGALFALLLPRRPKTFWCLPFFILAAVAPDFDMLFSGDAIHFIRLHRGISHSVFTAPLIAFVIALLARPLWHPSTKDNVSLATVWLYFLACIGLHLLLDCFTTFGAKVFLPFSDVRIHLNTLFMVDPFLAVPMLVLALLGRFAGKTRFLASAGIVWALAYPLLCLGLNHANATAMEDDLEKDGHTVSRLTILPDFFSPFYWRAIYIEEFPDGCSALREQSLSGLGRPRGKAGFYTLVPQKLVTHLEATSSKCLDFLDITELPIATPMAEKDVKAARLSLSFLPDLNFAKSAATCATSFSSEEHEGHPACSMKNFVCEDMTYFILSDLHFGSSLAIGRDILQKICTTGNPLKMMLVLDKDDNVVIERMAFDAPFRGTGWSRSVPPEPQTFSDWLLGTK